jgi:hypothetical protein
MRTHPANTAPRHLFQVFWRAWVPWEINGMEVLEGLPQVSHSQWWRISPPSMNSEAIGATIRSPQLGQRAGVVNARIAESFARYS